LKNKTILDVFENSASVKVDAATWVDSYGEVERSLGNRQCPLGIETRNQITKQTDLMEYKAVFLFVILNLSMALRVYADKTDEYIKTQIEKRHIPAVAVALIKDRKVSFTKEYGTANVELSVPADSETVFEIASLTTILQRRQS
jgi:CubicO group peptidase (beta-lactamase class C family)